MATLTERGGPTYDETEVGLSTEFHLDITPLDPIRKTSQTEVYNTIHTATNILRRIAEQLDQDTLEKKEFTLDTKSGWWAGVSMGLSLFSAIPRYLTRWTHTQSTSAETSRMIAQWGARRYQLLVNTTPSLPEWKAYQMNQVLKGMNDSEVYIERGVTRAMNEYKSKTGVMDNLFNLYEEYKGVHLEKYNALRTSGRVKAFLKGQIIPMIRTYAKQTFIAMTVQGIMTYYTGPIAYALSGTFLLTVRSLEYYHKIKNDPGNRGVLQFLTQSLKGGLTTVLFIDSFFYFGSQMFATGHMLLGFHWVSITLFYTSKFFFQQLGYTLDPALRNQRIDQLFQKEQNSHDASIRALLLADAREESMFQLLWNGYSQFFHYLQEVTEDGIMIVERVFRNVISGIVVAPLYIVPGVSTIAPLVHLGVGKTLDIAMKIVHPLLIFLQKTLLTMLKYAVIAGALSVIMGSVVRAFFPVSETAQHTEMTYTVLSMLCAGWYTLDRFGAAFFSSVSQFLYAYPFLLQKGLLFGASFVASRVLVGPLLNVLRKDVYTWMGFMAPILGVLVGSSSNDSLGVAAGIGTVIAGLNLTLRFSWKRVNLVKIVVEHLLSFVEAGRRRLFEKNTGWFNYYEVMYGRIDFLHNYLHTEEFVSKVVLDGYMSYVIKDIISDTIRNGSNVYNELFVDKKTQIDVATLETFQRSTRKSLREKQIQFESISNKKGKLSPEEQRVLLDSGKWVSYFSSQDKKLGELIRTASDGKVQVTTPSFGVGTILLNKFLLTTPADADSAEMTNTLYKQLSSEVYFLRQSLEENQTILDPIRGLSQLLETKSVREGLSPVEFSNQVKTTFDVLKRKEALLVYQDLIHNPAISNHLASIESIHRIFAREYVSEDVWNHRKRSFGVLFSQQDRFEYQINSLRDSDVYKYLTDPAELDKYDSLLKFVPDTPAFATLYRVENNIRKFQNGRGNLQFASRLEEYPTINTFSKEAFDLKSRDLLSEIKEQWLENHEILLEKQAKRIEQGVYSLEKEDVVPFVWTKIVQPLVDILQNTLSAPFQDANSFYGTLFQIARYSVAKDPPKEGDMLSQYAEGLMSFQSYSADTFKFEFTGSSVVQAITILLSKSATRCYSSFRSAGRSSIPRAAFDLYKDCWVLNVLDILWTAGSWAWDYTWVRTIQPWVATRHRTTSENIMASVSSDMKRQKDLFLQTHKDIQQLEQDLRALGEPTEFLVSLRKSLIREYGNLRNEEIAYVRGSTQKFHSFIKQQIHSLSVFSGGDASLKKQVESITETIIDTMKLYEVSISTKIDVDVDYLVDFSGDDGFSDEELVDLFKRSSDSTFADSEETKRLLTEELLIDESTFANQMDVPEGWNDTFRKMAKNALDASTWTMQFCQDFETVRKHSTYREVQPLLDKFFRKIQAAVGSFPDTRDTQEKFLSRIQDNHLFVLFDEPLRAELNKIPIFSDDFPEKKALFTQFPQLQKLESRTWGDALWLFVSTKNGVGVPEGLVTTRIRDSLLKQKETAMEPFRESMISGLERSDMLVRDIENSGITLNKRNYYNYGESGPMGVLEGLGNVPSGIVTTPVRFVRTHLTALLPFEWVDRPFQYFLKDKVTMAQSFVQDNLENVVKSDSTFYNQWKSSRSSGAALRGGTSGLQEFLLGDTKTPTRPSTKSFKELVTSVYGVEADYNELKAYEDKYDALIQSRLKRVKSYYSSEAFGDFEPTEDELILSMMVYFTKFMRFLSQKKVIHPSEDVQRKIEEIIQIQNIIQLQS